MVAFYGHAGLMGASLLLMASGAALARFAKPRRGWLDRHRQLGLSGAASAVIGLSVAVLMIQSAEGSHFGSPHTYLGALTLITALATPALGFAQFRYRQKAALIRTAHRWFGRATLLMMLITWITGLNLAGVF